MRENCLKQFDEHWNCLEANNQVRWASCKAFGPNSSLRLPRNITGVGNPNEHLTSACSRNL